MVSEREIEHAADLLRRGRLVAFPTETVYGLGANALDGDAVDRIFEAKGRPPTSPLIVHVHSNGMARGLARVWPETAERLAERFWPGPLTIVVPKRPQIADRVTAGLNTVGLRVPAHPVAIRLIEAAGVPVAAPSANKFGQLSPTTAQHVQESLGSAVDFILDGGPSMVGIESTVVSLVGEQPLLLRPGMISHSDLESVIGPVQIFGDLAHAGAHPSPGLHARHYSPTTKLMIGEPINQSGVYLWWHSDSPAARSIRLPAEPGACAAELYDLLHRLDSEGWDHIAVEQPPDGPEWAGIRDRLLRAATN
jgi:L-threonylcarbamoyladenylate synthase